MIRLPPVSDSKSKARRSDRRGFTLVQVLVVLGIMAIIGYAFTTMMVNSAREAKSVSAKADFNSLTNTMQSFFNNTDTCLTTFGGADAPNLTTIPTPISLKVGAAEKIEAGKYGSLEIKSLNVTDKQPSSENGQWVITLVLEADRGAGAVGGSSLRHEFKLLAELDATGKMTACSGQFSNYWVQTGNHITYLQGNVGIGVANPEQKLDVDGTVQGKAFLYKSDRRLKENVREVPHALDRIARLRGVLFNWKNADGRAEGPDQIGLIAQEVEREFPEAVVTDSRTGMKSVAYANLVSPLIEALKEQREIIRRQQKEIDEIKKALADSGRE